MMKRCEREGGESGKFCHLTSAAVKSLHLLNVIWVVHWVMLVCWLVAWFVNISRVTISFSEFSSVSGIWARINDAGVATYSHLLRYWDTIQMNDDEEQSFFLVLQYLVTVRESEVKDSEGEILGSHRFRPVTLISTRLGTNCSGRIPRATNIDLAVGFSTEISRLFSQDGKKKMPAWMAFSSCLTQG